MSWTKIANAYLNEKGMGGGWKMVEQEFFDHRDGGCLFLRKGNQDAYVHISEGEIEDFHIGTNGAPAKAHASAEDAWLDGGEDDC